MNDTSNSSFVRLVRLVRPHGNPLSRGVDRLEGTLLVAAVLIGMTLVPIMLVFGSITYASIAAAGDREATAHIQVVATLTEDAPPLTASAYDVGQGASDVRAEWQTPDGVLHTGAVRADNGMRAGAKVDIWLDENARVVDAPVTSGEAATAGVFVAVVGWLTAVGLLALTHLGVHRALDRRRFRAWEQEWAQVQPDWNRRYH